MKKALVLMLAILFVGIVGMARTDMFDVVIIEGTVAFTGTTIDFSPSTSFATYSPLIYLGYDAGARMTFTFSDTTGDLAITHTGSNKTVTWTVPELIVAGNMTVDGTTTTIDTVNMTVEDKNIILGNVQTPSDTTADGGGFTLKGATDKTITWDNANDNWTFNQAINLASGLGFKINNTSVLNATTLGAAVVSSSLTTVGTIQTGTWTADVIAHEYGGLEADVNAYDGLVKITGGATSAVTVTTFAESILDDASEADFKTTTNLTIGTDVQAWDAELDDLAGLTFADNYMIIGTGAGTIGTISCTVFAQSILDDADAATVLGTLDTGLADLATVTMGADLFYYTDADNSHQTASVTAYARTFLDDSSEGVFHATVNLETGTDVQAWDAQLDDIAALVQSDSYVIVGDDSNWVQETGATLRTSLGLAIDSDVQAHSADLDTIAAAATTATNEGVVFISQFTIAYTQTDSYTVCIVPANADVTKVEVVTTTAFTGGSATTIDVGYVGTLEAYASNLNVRSAGFADCDEFANLGDVGGTDVTMKAQIATDDSAGACTVYIYWTMGTPGTP